MGWIPNPDCTSHQPASSHGIIFRQALLRKGSYDDLNPTFSRKKLFHSVEWWKQNLVINLDGNNYLDAFPLPKKKSNSLFKHIWHTPTLLLFSFSSKEFNYVTFHCTNVLVFIIFLTLRSPFFLFTYSTCSKKNALTRTCAQEIWPRK